MPHTGNTTRVLSDAQIAQFIQGGFVKIEGAFPRDVADEGRIILWRDTGCDLADPTTWTKPVIRLGLYGQAPFAQAANTPILHRALDQLVGPGHWLPRMNLGTFPSGFRPLTIRGTPAGTSMSVLPPRPPTRTISSRGGRTSPRRGGRCYCCSSSPISGRTMRRPACALASRHRQEARAGG
jgi:hypothetical protein